MRIALLIVTRPSCVLNSDTEFREVLSAHVTAESAIAAGRAWQAKQPDSRFHYVVQMTTVEQ